MRQIQIQLNRRDNRIQVKRTNSNIRLGVTRHKISLTHNSGHRGPQGKMGTLAVGSTTTLPAGSQADVENVGTDSAAVLDFFIPKGDKGDQGETGVSTFVRVHHGSNPNILRPNAYFVEWVGSVAPLNGTVEDTWIDTA